MTTINASKLGRVLELFTKKDDGKLDSKEIEALKVLGDDLKPTEAKPVVNKLVALYQEGVSRFDSNESRAYLQRTLLDAGVAPAKLGLEPPKKAPTTPDEFDALPNEDLKMRALYEGFDSESGICDLREGFAHEAIPTRSLARALNDPALVGAAKAEMKNISKAGKCLCDEGEGPKVEIDAIRKDGQVWGYSLHMTANHGDIVRTFDRKMKPIGEMKATE
ncbi:MAG: hypothetical protein HY901_06940 [Deltaproteobacteria bacterium]|nr:hypothetical protein [Deltaproteobacteria bacterium]